MQRGAECGHLILSLSRVLDGTPNSVFKADWISASDLRYFNYKTLGKTRSIFAVESRYQVLIYLCDILFSASSVEILTFHVRASLNLLSALRYKRNLEKSISLPPRLPSFRELLKGRDQLRHFLSLKKPSSFYIFINQAALLPASPLMQRS